ncbi:hypothetical protein [Thalassobellus suaedae]|uniref:Uncharacterized protein n=1 Tax=Thalassobellus suaedae TaxID=3074124 RepID=A0ABY9XX10_9FLAO|nr:hypothetical protein RHP51_07515 [Flavobacteriaceae bacterium HL-DH14]
MKMVDYIKMLLVNIDIERLKNLPCLDFITGVSEQTGELLNKKEADYHQCKITVYDTGIIIFSGSIHKLYNSLKSKVAPNHTSKNIKGFNGNQFNLKNLIEMQNHLTNLFDCKPQQMEIRSIEIGVNAEPQLAPSLFIKGLLYHKNKMFEYRFNRNFAKVDHQHFDLKIYNKSKQYNMKTDTLRIELKFNKMRELKSIGIVTLADINQITLKEAFKLFLKRFDEIIYYDKTIYLEGLTKSQIASLERYSNPRYWIDELKPNHRHRHKENLNKIILKNSKNLHQIIRTEIIKKCSIITQLSESEIVA